MKFCTSILGLIALATLSGAAHAQGMPADLGWRSLDDRASGTHLDYPAALFSTAQPSDAPSRPGQLFTSADGRAHLAVFSVHNPRQGSAAAFIARNLRVPSTALHYQRTTPRFFVISGIHDDAIYYARCNASADHALLHCINLVYPARDKRRWDPVVTRISRTLRAFR